MQRKQKISIPSNPRTVPRSMREALPKGVIKNNTFVRRTPLRDARCRFVPRPSRTNVRPLETIHTDPRTRRRLRSPPPRHVLAGDLQDPARVSSFFFLLPSPSSKERARERERESKREREREPRERDHTQKYPGSAAKCSAAYIQSPSQQ